MSEFLFWSLLLTLFLTACWGASLFGLPGSLGMIAAMVGFGLAFPPAAGPGLGWWVVGWAVGFILLGEVVEFFAGAAGLTKGGSKRAAALATVGSLLGGLFGFGLGGPLGVLFFSAAGALAGAMIGELWKGRSSQESWEFGKLAFWARLLGSVAKAVFGGIAIGIVLFAILRQVILW